MRFVAKILQKYPEIQREFQRVGETLRSVWDWEVLHRFDGKPREGMVRYADGTNWNPGSGKGMYYYNGTTWIFMGYNP